MDVDEIMLTAEDAMEKAVEYFKGELRGLRTGRASTGLVDFIKVEYYGSPTDLRSIAAVSVPEPAQLLVKPFDASSVQAIIKAIQTAGLGLNPVAEGKQVRISLPSLSGDRRNQLIATLKQTAELARVSVRNARRDANKHLDVMAKDKSAQVSEDAIEMAKEDVQGLLKRFEASIDDLVASKTKEIQEV